MNRLPIEPAAVGTLSDAWIVAWDQFVEKAQATTFFHKAGWKAVIERSFGHRCYFLFTSHGARITGVLPLVHINSRWFGKALISLGFGVYGGPVAETSAATDALDHAAQDLARDLAVDYLEYRLKEASGRGWPGRSDFYATFVRDLEPDADAVFLSLPRKRRAEIRSTAKHGLTAVSDGDLGRFYPIYAESVRNLGSPVFSRRYFETLLQVFSEDTDVLTVLCQGRPVSSVLSFYFRDEVLPYYGGGTAEARAVSANDFMYWELMRRSCEHGVRVFDFGRSRHGTGSFAYKKNWGFAPRNLSYEYYLVRRRDMPSVNPANPSYRRFIQLWRHLPLALTNRIGPIIANDLG